MARCKLTNMNLRNIRKTREYQCLLIDLVKTGVVGKSAAEGLLGYTIPEGLLGDSTPVTSPDDEDEAEPRLITIAARVSGGKDLVYESFDYDLNDGDTAEDILAAANNHWTDGDDDVPFNTISSLTPDQNSLIVINGESYAISEEEVDSFEPGAIYEVSFVPVAAEEEPGLVP